MKSNPRHPPVPSGTLLGSLWLMGFVAIKRNVLHSLRFLWFVTRFLMPYSRFRRSEEIHTGNCTENLIKMVVNTFKLDY